MHETNQQKFKRLGTEIRELSDSFDQPPVKTAAEKMDIIKKLTAINAERIGILVTLTKETTERIRTEQRSKIKRVFNF